MSTAEVTEETPAEQPTVDENTTKAEATIPEEVAPVESAPEPQPHGDVYPCNVSAKGTFDKGVADLKTEEDSDIDLERTQLLILVKDGRRYTFNRTNIEPIS